MSQEWGILQVLSTMGNQATFQERLQKLHRGTLARVAFFGLARLVGVGGSMVLLTLWMLGSAVQPGKFVTWGLLLSLSAGLAALSWNHLLGTLWRLRSVRRLVERLEQRGHFANILIASEEAGRDPGRWPQDNPVSQELRRRLFDRGARLLQTIGPAEAYSFQRSRQTGMAWVLFLVLFAFLISQTGGILPNGWQRLWHPTSIWSDPPSGGLYAVRGPGFVVVGGDLTLAALDATGDQNTAHCEIKVGSGLWREVPVHRETMVVEPLGITPPYRKWVASLAEVQEGFQWRFRRGEMVTKVSEVAVRRYPLITGLSGFVDPPQYTRLSRREMDRLPTWLEVPTGSLLGFAGEANHPLTKMTLITDAGDTTELDFADRSFFGEFPVNSSLDFHLVLEDEFGLLNLDPLHYEVVAKADEAPRAALDRVADDGILPLNGQVELLVEAADDYGVTSLSLELRVLVGGEGTQPIKTGGSEFEKTRIWEVRNPQRDDGRTWRNWHSTRGEIRFKSRPLQEIEASGNEEPLQVGLAVTVSLEQLDLIPGDILELRVLAQDNRQPPPVGEGVSSVLRLSFPSAAEVLVAQADSSQARRSELEQMRQRGRQLGADLDRLNRELLKNPIPDWARQKEMEAAIERQKKMQQELARVAAQLQQDVDKLASGQMTSEKMLERAEQVSQLLDQSQSAQLSEMMKKMEKSEGQVSPKDLAEAMKEVARNQKEMARKLDAALAMLQRMDQEQEMEGIASLLEKMIRKQQELADLSRELAESKKQEGSPESSEQNPENEPPNAEDLARRQEALNQEMDQLQEKLEEALANLEEQNTEKSDPTSKEMQEALEQALEQMEQKKSKESMEQASQELSQMDPEMAAKMQEQALRDMGALYHVILKSQSAMQAAMEQQQVTSLRKLAADMLTLSARQETIAAGIPPRIRDVRSLGLTRSQHRVQQAAVGVRDRLSELMKENPNRIMKLLEKLDVVIEKMGESLNSLEDNRAQTARSAATNSLALTNRMVIGLLTEAQMSSPSSGGKGDQQQQQKSMSEQLKDMAKDQAELNSLTEKMRQMLANRGISQQARSQMKRLGEGQGNLASRMQDLAEEARKNPEGERVLGDLGELGNLMETLSQEVEQGLVSEETLIRQERILSRMLDARNSVRQRNYSSRRESHTARQLYGEDGSLLDDPSLGQGRDPFDLRYQPLEKAPLEYRGLVRKYFQALEKFRQTQQRGADIP